MEIAPGRIEWLKKQQTTPAKLRNCAFHEASHVVVAACEHVRVTKVTIEWEFGGDAPDAIHSCGRTSFDESSVDHLDYLERILKAARTALAGGIGEQLACGREPRMLRYIGTDLAVIKTAEQCLTFEYSEEARRAWLRLQWLIARDTLHKHWDFVKAIAEALLERETLTGEETHEILTANGFYGARAVAPTLPSASPAPR